MVDEFDEDFPEEEEEVKEEKREERRGRPAKPVPSPVSKYKQIPKETPKETPKEKYAAFHIPERAGVVNLETDKPVGEDVLSLLAVILNDLQVIKEAVC